MTSKKKVKVGDYIVLTKVCSLYRKIVNEGNIYKVLEADKIVGEQDFVQVYDKVFQGFIYIDVTEYVVPEDQEAVQLIYDLQREF